MTDKKKLFAIIAVAHEGERTFYVKRSLHMANYPGVWSLPSIQFDSKELGDPTDLRTVAHYVDTMSRQRLGGAALRIEELLTSGNSDDNPIDRDVHLYLYRVAFQTPPVLNPDFYTDSRWMTASEFEEASADQTCGLCVRLWADHAWMLGIADHPYAHKQVSHAR
jgi:hypothetical protein